MKKQANKCKKNSYINNQTNKQTRLINIISYNEFITKKRKYLKLNRISNKKGNESIQK